MPRFIFNRELLFISLFLILSMFFQVVPWFFLKDAEIQNRYIWPLLLSPIILQPVFFSRLFEFKFLLFRQKFSFFVLIPYLFVFFVLFNFLNITPKYPLYNDILSCFDKTMSKYNLHRGISNRWDSRYFSVLSKEKTAVHGLDNNNSPIAWMDNSQRIDTVYDFAIVATESSLWDINKDKIIKYSGTPKEIVSCASNREIWIYGSDKLALIPFPAWRKKYSWDGCDLANHVGHKNESLCMIQAEEGDVAGYIHFGPSLNLSNGYYECILEAEIQSDYAEGSVGHLAVEGEGVHVSQNFYDTNLKVEDFKLKFKLESQQKVQSVIFKSYYNKHGKIKIHRMTLRRI